MRFALVTAVLLSGLAAVPAHAMDDMSYDWSGFHAGITTGYGLANATSTGVPSGTVQDIGLSGALLGANLGYSGQFDNFVLGVDGDLSWSGISGSAVCVADPTFTCTGDVDWLATINGRAGIGFDRALLYATAGLALSGLEAHVANPPPAFTGVHSGVGIGWNLGVGVEVAVTETVSLKAEFSHVDLGSTRAPVGTLGAANAYDLTGTANIAKVGMNFRF